jgi:hypothetical protein
VGSISVIPESVSLTGSESSRGWRPGDWWSVGFRLLLLLVLAAAVATIAGSVRPAERSRADLIADLAAGRVSYLDYERIDHRVRWVTGWGRWRTTTLVSWPDNGAVDGQGDAALEWLYRQIDASGHPVPVTWRVGNEPTWWPVKVVWEPLRTATVAACLGTFLIMLGRTRHRYANRWAWFWLFTVGQAGVLLYLILEPRPMWRPRSWLPHQDRTPIRGGAGFLWAILLSIVVGLVTVGIAAI